LVFTWEKAHWLSIIRARHVIDNEHVRPLLPTSSIGVGDLHIAKQKETDLAIDHNRKKHTWLLIERPTPLMHYTKSPLTLFPSKGQRIQTPYTQELLLWSQKIQKRYSEHFLVAGMLASLSRIIGNAETGGLVSQDNAK